MIDALRHHADVDSPPARPEIPGTGAQGVDSRRTSPAALSLPATLASAVLSLLRRGSGRLTAAPWRRGRLLQRVGTAGSQGHENRQRGTEHGG